MIKKHIIYTDFLNWKFTVKKAQGSFVWTENGQKLIDFSSGWNVTNLGWNHPEISEAMAKQAKKNTFTPMWTNDDIQEEYANELVKSLPKDLNVLCRTTGGTDANEKAMLMARYLTARKKIIGMRDTYHGHSFGTISIGYRSEFVEDIAPLVPAFIHLPFPSAYESGKSEKETLNEFLNLLESKLKNRDVAAIITESDIITGWGSTLVAPKGYITAVRKLTQKYGTLLILDEVGTGFSRCGKLFGMELENIVPDMATFAKAITNGADVLSAVAVNKNILVKDISPAKTHSTFGWMSVPCAAALKTLQIHKREQVWKKAEINGNYLLSELKQQLTNHPLISNIDGLGMEIGVTFVRDKRTKEPNYEFAKKVVTECLIKGLHLAPNDNNIQIMPPLTTPKSVLKAGLDIFVDVVNSISK